MNRKLTINKYRDRGLVVNEAIKVTALADLKEALTNEEYERCAELIQAARDTGANVDEVRGLLLEAVRGVKGAVAKGARG